MKKLLILTTVLTISIIFAPHVVATKVDIDTVKTSSCGQSGGVTRDGRIGQIDSALADPDVSNERKEELKEEKKQLERSSADTCVGGNSIAAVFRTVTNILLFLVGAVAVIMLVVGGFKYVTSNGDQNAITSAKNTILYAIIGIIVAFMAFAAVNFVVGSLT